MKKIIATVTNDLTFDQRMMRICKSLAEEGHDVTLVGRSLPGSLPLAELPYRQKRLRLFFKKGKCFYIEYNLRLLMLLLFSRFDLVHAVDLDTLLPGFLVSKIKGKVCVYDAHEYFTEVPEVVERPGVKRAWEWLAGQVVPRLRFAITVGPCLAAVFRERYGTCFEVIRNVPERRPPLPHSAQKEGPFILLYQGVLNEGRGLEEAIEAMELLQDAELWLAGEGDCSEALRLMTKKRGLEHKVKFLGKIPPPELARLTPQAHLGLNLLKNKGLNYYYSLANKAFDYIQAGLPSLGMDFPEYRRLNEDWEVAHLLPDVRPAAIAVAVNALRSDPNRYRTLAENCRRAAETLHWENEEKTLLEFYRKAFSG